MMQLARVQRFFEELLRSFVSILTNGTTQASAIGRCRTFRHSLKDFILRLGEFIDVVNEIDHQKFGRQRSGKARLHTKRKFAAAQLEVAMTFVVIDDGSIVKLRRADTQTVVGIWRSQKKRVILEE